MKILSPITMGGKNEKGIYTDINDQKQGEFHSEHLIAASYLRNNSPSSTDGVHYQNRVVIAQNKTIFSVVHSPYPVIGAYCPWLLTVGVPFGKAYINSTTPSLNINFKVSSKTPDNTADFYCTTVLPYGEYSGFDYISTGLNVHQTHKMIPEQMAMPATGGVLLDYLPHIPQSIAMPHIMLASGAPDEIVTLQVPHYHTTNHYQTTTPLSSTGFLSNGTSATPLVHRLDQSEAACNANLFLHFALSHPMPDWVRACHPQSYFIIPSTTTLPGAGRYHQICVCISSSCQFFSGQWRWVGFFITQSGAATLDTAMPPETIYSIKLGYWA